jgi:hypothetical protein
LSIAIMSGCASVRAELPERPRREPIQKIETAQDVVDALNYYEHLVEEWEVWADTVEALR